MEVILREDVEKLGTRGQLVKVAPGYARNFLLPNKMAVAATESNKKIVEQERQAHLRREAKVEGEAGDLGKMMGAVAITIRAKGRRERPALRFGDLQGHRRGARKAGLHHRAPQDRAGGADQNAGRVQGSRAVASRSDRGNHGHTSSKRKSSSCHAH